MSIKELLSGVAILTSSQLLLVKVNLRATSTHSMLKTCKIFCWNNQYLAGDRLHGSVAVIPPPEFRGAFQNDGFLHPDDYWHAEIIDLRKYNGTNYVCYILLSWSSYYEQFVAKVCWFWRKEDLTVAHGVKWTPIQHRGL